MGTAGRLDLRAGNPGDLGLAKDNRARRAALDGAVLGRTSCGSMQSPNPAPTVATPRREIPRAGLRRTIRAMLGGSRERIHMLARLQELYERFGNVVLQDVGVLKFVNLYGPDANRLVLMDRDRIFGSTALGAAM